MPNDIATVTHFPRFLGRLRSSQTMQSNEPAPNDLEVLDQIIKTRRNEKVIADATLARAQIAAEEAAQNLIAAVDELETELKSRGSLCRK